MSIMTAPEITGESWSVQLHIEPGTVPDLLSHGGRSFRPNAVRIVLGESGEWHATVSGHRVANGEVLTGTSLENREYEETPSGDAPPWLSALVADYAARVPPGD